jgi:hypothetical protein
MIKILYFDTSAIVKYFCKERGSEVITWIVENRAAYSLSLNTSQIALHELKHKVLPKKVTCGGLSREHLRRISTKLKGHPPIFRIIDLKPPPGFRSGKDTAYHELCMRHGLSARKNSSDMRHLACVINYLRCFDGPSRPRVLSSDHDFNRTIEAEGFDVINPEKITKDEFLNRVLKNEEP